MLQLTNYYYLSLLMIILALLSFSLNYISCYLGNISTKYGVVDTTIENEIIRLIAAYHFDNEIQIAFE